MAKAPAGPSVWQGLSLALASRFEVRSAEITNLIGAYNLTRVSSRSLLDNFVSDRASLAGPTSPTFLGLQQNSASDLIPLAALRNLKDLDMDKVEDRATMRSPIARGSSALTLVTAPHREQLGRRHPAIRSKYSASSPKNKALG